jgi:hypothetical protein
MSDDYDEPYADADDGPEPGEECGRWSNGRLTRWCSKAGTEECDFGCPHRDARTGTSP